MPGITKTFNTSPVYFACVCKSDDDHSVLLYYAFFLVRTYHQKMQLYYFFLPKNLHVVIFMYFSNWFC